MRTARKKTAEEVATVRTRLNMKLQVEKLEKAFQAKNFTALASYGAVENEDGDWEYHISGSDLPAKCLHVPMVLLWSSRMAARW